jgi:two-component system, NarL family, sensor histidine kinase DevS
MSQTALGEMLRTGHAERLTDSSSRMRLGLGELTDQTGAAMLVPLSFHGRALGLLVALDRFDSTTAYSADDERLLRAFASSAATALATAQNVEAEQLRMSIAGPNRSVPRWARELHDETLQGLGALQVMLTAALRQDEDAVRRAAELVVGQIETQVQELHGLITELRPAALDDLGLSPALDTLYARVHAAQGLEVTSQRDLVSEARDEGSRLAPEIDGTIYRLVQEALTNIAKHANTGRAPAPESERRSPRVTGSRTLGRPLKSGGRRRAPPSGAPGSPPAGPGRREPASWPGGDSRPTALPRHGRAPLP